MIISQVSVFMENKPGCLYSVADILARSEIDIRSLTLADTDEYGIVRLIVDRSEDAMRALRDEGIIVKLNHVVAVAMNDTPGGALEILRVLGDKGVNIEYLYACVGHVSGKALMVIRTDDNERTDKILHDSGFGDVNPADIYKL